MRECESARSVTSYKYAKFMIEAEIMHILVIDIVSLSDAGSPTRKAIQPTES